MSESKKVALVTGGSKGIGKSICNLLSQQGFVVYSGSRNGNGNLDTFLDICDEKSVANIFKKILKEQGRLDVLVNNAGIASRSPIESCEISEWDSVIKTNLTGAFLCSREAIRIFLRHRYGCIVNVCSIAGKLYSSTASEAYTCSKYGMVGLTRQLAHRYASKGIRVNAVCPSQTLTEMLFDGTTENERSRLSSLNPMGRLANENEVAEVVKFLISEKCEYVNGACFDINGGLL